MMEKPLASDSSARTLPLSYLNKHYKSEESDEFEEQKEANAEKLRPETERAAGAKAAKGGSIELLEGVQIFPSEEVNEEPHVIYKSVAYDQESPNDGKLRQSLSNAVEENIILRSRIKQLNEELNRRGQLIARMTLRIGNEDRLKEVQRLKRKVSSFDF